MNFIQAHIGVLIILGKNLAEFEKGGIEGKDFSLGVITIKIHLIPEFVLIQSAFCELATHIFGWRGT